MTYRCEMGAHTLVIAATGLPEARRKLRAWAAVQDITVTPAVWQVLDQTQQASATLILAPFK